LLFLSFKSKFLLNLLSPRLFIKLEGAYLIGFKVIVKLVHRVGVLVQNFNVVDVVVAK